MDISIVVIKVTPKLFCLEHQPTHLENPRDIELIALHRSPLVLDSFGQCNEFHRLTNKRNHYFE